MGFFNAIKNLNWTIPDFAPREVPEASNCTCHSPPSVTTTENAIMFAAAVAPVLLSICPLIVFLVNGSVAQTIQVIRTPILNVSTITGILWLFYSQILRREDLHADELVLSNGFCVIFAFCYIMMAYGHRRKLWKAVALIFVVVPSMIFLFAALRWYILLPDFAKVSLGWTAVGAIFGGHVIQIIDIATAEIDVTTVVVTGLNVFIPCLANASVCYWYWFVSPQQHFILWLESFINSLCYLMELLVLITRTIQHSCNGGAIDNDDDGGNGPHPGGSQNSVVPVRNAVLALGEMVNHGSSDPRAPSRLNGVVADLPHDRAEVDVLVVHPRESEIQEDDPVSEIQEDDPPRNQMPGEDGSEVPGYSNAAKLSRLLEARRRTLFLEGWGRDEKRARPPQDRSEVDVLVVRRRESEIQEEDPVSESQEDDPPRNQMPGEDGSEVPGYSNSVEISRLLEARRRTLFLEGWGRDEKRARPKQALVTDSKSAWCVPRMRRRRNVARTRC